MACAGSAISFDNATWRAGATSFLWSFPGGTPTTSTAENPTVTYAADGYYSVTLTATNAVGSDTKTFENMIYISGAWSAFTGPTMQDFNGGADFWVVQNPENNHAQFSRVTGRGKDLTPCYRLNNYKNVAGAPQFTSDWFYYNRLGGSRDYLISPAYNLSSTSNVTVTFDYAYGTRTTELDEITEKLVVWSSKDCGKTWQIRKTIDNEEVVTAGYVGDADFAPTSNSQWRTASFNYSATGADTKTRFRFEFVASDHSSNLYIDNVNISGTLGISDNDDAVTGITLSPNPVATGSAITVEISDASKDMQLQVVDVNGQVISTTQVVASNGTQTVTIPMNVAKGCYFLQATKGNARSTHRVIVF
jgi:PKD repeat protein